VVGSLLICPPAPLSKGRRQPQPARACEGRPETFRYAHRAPYPRPPRIHRPCT
jgi:hypothetical protein